MLSFSVNVPFGALSDAHYPKAQAVLDSLLALVDRFSVPVTWCVADFRTKKLIDGVLGMPTEQEFALLLTSTTWEDRTSLAHTLNVAVKDAAERGIRFEVLALSAHKRLADFDLLVRHRIRAVRGPTECKQRFGQRHNLRPLSARFGIWYVPVNLAIGYRIPWWTGGYRWIDAAVLQGRSPESQLHVVFDLDAALKDEVDLVRLARRIFSRLEAWRRAGHQSVALLSQLVREKAAVVLPNYGLQSVLRRSA